MVPASRPRTPLASAVDDLASGNPSVVESARERIVALGPAAMEPLLGLLDAESDELRLRAISLLALFSDARTSVPLAALLHDGSARIRQRAAGALARTPSPAVVAALVRLLDREAVVAVRVVAVRSLVRMLRAGRDEALRPLMLALSNGDEDPRVRVAALDAVPWIVHLDRSTEEAVAQLLRRLAGSGEPRVAAKARRLRETPPRIKLESDAIEQLIAELASGKLAVWRRALTVLGAGGGAIVEPLLSAMMDRGDDAEFLRRCGLALKGLSARQLSPVGRSLDSVDHPLVLQALVEIAAEAGSRALLAKIASLVERLAERRKRGGDDALDRARARAHVALARAGSRLAAADLRTMLRGSAAVLMPQLAEAASLVGTRAELPSLLAAYLAASGVTRLKLRDAALDIARRERLRRNDRWVCSLPDRERRAAVEILGQPRPRRKTVRLRPAGVDTASGSLLT